MRRTTAERVLRRSWNKETRALLEKALRDPRLRWARPTRSGAILAGPGGMVTLHAGPSDRRALGNQKRDLRKAGLG